MTWDGNNAYKYNGKELDKMHGLNLYDYSARHYDPAIGRFTSVDPLAEMYYSISPYVYVANNPIKFIDPDGRSIYNYDTEQYEDADGNVISFSEALLLAARAARNLASNQVIEANLNPVITDFAVLGEFLLGVGPQHRTFDENSSSSRSLRNSHLTRIALKKYFEMVAESGKSRYTFPIGFSPLERNGAGPVAELIASNNYTTAQFVGSAEYTIEREGDMLKITVTNKTSQNSLFFHIPGIGKPSREETPFGMMGNINQTYIFYIPIGEAKQKADSRF